MELGRARQVAEQFCGLARPFCKRLEVAGSVRRGAEFVNDIDIVLIAPSLVRLYQFLAYERQHDFTIVKWGKKLASLTYEGAQIDLYFATWETWATLLLIRTGSRQNNIRLCALAEAKGWQLKADGSGLFDGAGNRIAGQSEESIYKALGVPYQEPKERR